MLKPRVRGLFSCLARASFDQSQKTRLSASVSKSAKRTAAPPETEHLTIASQRTYASQPSRRSLAHTLVIFYR